MASWRDKVHAINPNQTLIPPKIDPEINRVVSDALLAETQIEIIYDSMQSGKGKSVNIHPHALIHRGQMSYLVGACWQYKDMRRFAMHRASFQNLQCLKFSISYGVRFSGARSDNGLISPFFNVQASTPPVPKGDAPERSERAIN